MAGRQYLPHQTPHWIDHVAEVWFVTISCQLRGENQLAHESIGSGLLKSVAYYQERHHWYAHIFLLMPDHCHALLSFPLDRPVAKTIRDWKRWCAGQYGIAWQIDFFEHRLRGDEGFREKAEYIRQNPVRAGLVAAAEDWPYVWQAGDSQVSRDTQYMGTRRSGYPYLVFEE